MKLSKIEIKNFKSFKNLSIYLNDFNVLIGACASGKSNFIEIFRFVKDISEDFEKAISKHGGDYYLKNSNLNSINNPCYLKTSFIKTEEEDLSFPIFGSKSKDKEQIIIEYENIDYELKFNFENINSYKILNEKFSFSGNTYIIKNKNSKNNNDANYKKYPISFSLKNSEGNITKDLKYSENNINADDIIPPFLMDMYNNLNIEKKKKLIINSILPLVLFPLTHLFKNIKFYDFHPKLCKSIGLIGGEQTLTEQGDNLPIILDDILKNKEKRRKFLNLLNNLLPYITNIDVEKVMEDSRIFTLQENYNKTDIPAPLISDGTSDIIALIVALYFEEGDCILIEEPERNIHPSLLSKIVQMMKEVSDYKQIIITTHSPEVLKSADLEDIYLISRNSKGFSEITKPINNKRIKPFIEELGIDEVYVDDYLGLGNE